MPPKSSFGKSRNREFVNKLTILETIRSISKIKWKNSRKNIVIWKSSSVLIRM